MNTKITKNIPFPVSPLGLGTLTLGPFQKNLSFEEGADLIIHALQQGINLIDTADLYNTYPYIKTALQRLPHPQRNNIHIISRSYDYTYSGMKQSFERALKEMGVDGLSVFMLHEMESELTLKGHRDALKFLVEKKAEGKILATGLSTHYIRAVKGGTEHPDIDIIFALVNKEGIGIKDGTPDEMLSAMKSAHDAGKGILAMKVLGGGHLFRTATQSLLWAKQWDFIDSIIVGMQSREEIDFNINLINKEPRPQGKSPFHKDNLIVEDENPLAEEKPDTRSLYLKESPPIKEVPSLLPRQRRLLIEDYCLKCGNCVKICPFSALFLSEEDDRVKVDESKCLLCSYCARKCPEFCIKII